MPLGCLAAQADERDFSRDAYGQSSIPVWSALTDFEQGTVTGFHRAEAGDPEALLALYLVASGDVRSRPRYDAIRRRVIGEPLAMQTRNARDQGQQLLSLMFERYLQDSEGGDPLAGYAADQSQLSRIFETGQYNCISSSLLYIVLARHAGLEANGVILPSHAFVDITLPDGAVISVETTSPGGFNVEHDRAWFEGADEQWFRERDLEVPRYEDYQARQRVSAAGLGLENMWNQHAARLPYADRLRLAELQSHLRPDDVQAQMNRMIYYTREAAWLKAQADVATLDRFMERTADWHARMAEMLQRPAVSEDGAFRGLWYWLEIQRAAALIGSDRSLEGARRVEQALVELEPSVNDVETLLHNAHVALDSHARQLVDNGRLDEAASLAQRLPALCGEAALCQQALARIHSALAAVDWERADWAAAIAHFRAYLDTMTPRGEEFRPVIEQNMEGAWLYWAEQDWYDEFRDRAMDRLQRCISELTQAPRCREQLEAYRAEY